jgi:hypothetical protein
LKREAGIQEAVFTALATILRQPYKFSNTHKSSLKYSRPGVIGEGSFAVLGVIRLLEPQLMMKLPKPHFKATVTGTKG